MKLEYEPKEFRGVGKIFAVRADGRFVGTLRNDAGAWTFEPQGRPYPDAGDRRAGLPPVKDIMDGFRRALARP